MKTFAFQLYKKSLVLIFGFLILGFARQDDSKKTMTSFSPKSKAYDIYYPKGYSIKEDDEGIVNIWDTVSQINITISTHFVEQGMDDRKLITTLNGFVKDYYKKDLNESDWKSYKTKFDILVETKFKVDQTNWVWYGIVNKQRLIIFTINKDSVIEENEMKLVKFMIDSLVID